MGKNKVYMIRIIGHLDMDAFFAAVEERDHEWLRGKPIVVGADPLEGMGRGVVSTANYLAREYGIHSAMPISKAWRLSEIAKTAGKPEAIFVGVNGKAYHETSERIMSIVRNHVDFMEQVSVDEAYMDLSFTQKFSAAQTIAENIQQEIFAAEQLTCSVGIGPNKLIAKIASDYRKPHGFTVVTKKEAEKFMAPMPIRNIPGIGPKTEQFFFQKGIHSVADLKKFTKEELEERIGKWGLDLYDKARGRDDSPVTEEHEIKSIGEQETFPKDTHDPQIIMPHLQRMCRDVLERLKKSDFQAFRTVVVTVRFENFETKTRSRTLARPESSKNALVFEAMRLLMPFLDSRENMNHRRIRLIGVRVEKLS